MRNTPGWLRTHSGSVCLSHSPARNGKPGRSVVPLVLYLAVFVALLLFVSHYYLFPAIEATRGADPLQKAFLSASARLILAIVLFILLSGWLLAFRIGRFFRPRNISRPKPTQYIDAWQESARRLKVPDKQE